MASRPDPWHQALAHSQPTSAASASKCSENSETELKPTRGHKAAIAELVLRFPCPRDTDPDSYRARVEYLEKDVAHLAVPLLRAACDRAAQSARGLPYASEIINQATAIVEERQRVMERASNPVGGQTSAPDAKTAAYYAGNVAAMQRGSRFMQTKDGEMFELGSFGERRGVRNDGSVIEPWFHHEQPNDTITRGWWCKNEDAANLAHCFARFGSPYRMDGAKVVEA